MGNDIVGAVRVVQDLNKVAEAMSHTTPAEDAIIRAARHKLQLIEQRAGIVEPGLLDPDAQDLVEQAAEIVRRVSFTVNNLAASGCPGGG